MQKESLFWIWLSEVLGPKSRDFKTLIEVYESPYHIFHADENELERIPELSEKGREAVSQKDLANATRILSDCEQLGVHILTYADEAYPSNLRALRDPPILLYYLGDLPDLNKRLCIGMVGTRRMSAYGLQTAYKLSYELASANVVIVSGMAAGIDGVAAAGAVAAKGSTVAVLGCGIDVIYPRHHKVLRDLICQNGALLSEYPPGTKPNHYHFPVRNRIISGLAQGTVVVEASEGSGSLITAKDAVLQGRDVFAIPANVDSNGAEGTNKLLRDGAKLVLDVSDIIHPYEYAFSATLRTEALIKARKNSGADLSYLDRIGVIELTRRSAKAQPASVRAVDPPPERQATPKREPPRKKTVKIEQLQIDDAALATSVASPSELPELSPVQLAVMQAIPDDRAISADSFGSLGYPYSEIIAALTMLEIMGLVHKLPGALYTKA